MTITDTQRSILLESIASGDECVIAAAVFGLESLLREILTLIASHPEKLKTIGGPIKVVETVSEPDIFNVAVSVHSASAAEGHELTSNAQPIESLSAEDSDPMERLSAAEVEEETVDAEDSETVEQLSAVDYITEELCPTTDSVESVDHTVAETEDTLTTLDDDCLEFTTVTTTDGATVQVHIKAIDNKSNKRDTAAAAAKASGSAHPCPHCDMTFTRMFELQRHVTVRHTNEKPFECTECGKCFALKLYLKNHIRTRHQPDSEKPYGCVQCGYRCALPSMLNKHMERHANNKSFKCEVCDKYFHTVKHLELHMYRHQEKNLQCAYCDYKTANPYKLSSHTKTHTSTEVFTCNICTFNTNVRADLNKHKQNVHQTIEYTCEICHLTFKRITNLNRHMFVHQEKNLSCGHEGCGWRTADPYELKRHNREHMDGKKHTCEVCGFKCHRAFDLKKHSKIHLKKYECTYCGSKFVDSHQLACHKRRRHSKNSGDKATIIYTDRSQQHSEDADLEAYIAEGDNVTIEETVTQEVPFNSEALQQTGTHTIIVNENGEQIILEPGVSIADDASFIVSSSDQQLLEMASVIIAQEENAQAISGT